MSMNCESKEVIRKDSRAQALYEKVGFRVVGVHPDAFVLKDGTMRNEYLRHYRTIRRQRWRCLFCHLRHANSSIYRQ